MLLCGPCGGVCGGVVTGAGVDGLGTGFEGLAGGCGVVGLLEEVGVNAEGDVGVGVSQLSGDEDDVESSVDQSGGVVVPQGVRGQSPLAVQFGAFHRQSEGGADVAVV